MWETREHIEQFLFPGAHADVGGGYPVINNESGLSDIALLWMIEKLKTVSVLFGCPDCPAAMPDPAGISHKPWQHRPFKEGIKILRDFQGKSLLVHESIRQRMLASPVIQEPGEAPSPYRPKNLPS